MSRSLRAGLVAIAGLAGLAAAGGRAAAQAPVAPESDGFLEIAVPTTAESVLLRLTSDQPASLAETRRVHLAAGANRLRFDWIRERLDEATLRFEIAPEAGTATLSQRTKLHRRGGMTYFDVQASGPTAARITTRYLLAGLGWRVDYVGTLAADGASLALSMTAEITNRSGKELAGARLVFDGGELGALTLDPGERRELDVFQVEGVPVVRRFLFDPARFGATPAIELELANGPAGPLARPLLPAGKIRILVPQAEGPPGLLGEDVLPATPFGEKAKLQVGHARDLTVERTLALDADENERRDRWNKVVAFDHRTRVNYKLRNGSGQDATIVVVERPGNPWEVTSSSHPTVRTRSELVEMAVPVPAGAVVDASLEWLRRNLW